jgi:hypothetical protein
MTFDQTLHAFTTSAFAWAARNDVVPHPHAIASVIPDATIDRIVLVHRAFVTHAHIARSRPWCDDPLRPPQFCALGEACPPPIAQELARIRIDRHCSGTERGWTRAALWGNAATVVLHTEVAIHDQRNEPMVDDRVSAVRVIRNGEATEENLRIVTRLRATCQRQRA